jgi:hypothetical protein
MDGSSQFQRPSTPACRWRTSGETLDLIEALERIESLLLRLDERMREANVQEAAAGGREAPQTRRDEEEYR